MEKENLKNNQENTASEEIQPLFNVDFVLGKIDDIQTKEEFQKEITKKDYDKALEIFFKYCCDRFVKVYDKNIGFKHIDNPNIRTFNTSTEKDIILNYFINDLINEYKIHIANPMNIKFDSFLYLSILREEQNIKSSDEEAYINSFKENGREVYDKFFKKLFYNLTYNKTSAINIFIYLPNDIFKSMFVEMTGEIQVKFMLSMVLIILLSNQLGEAFFSQLSLYIDSNKIRTIKESSETAFSIIQTAESSSLELLEEIKKNNKKIEEIKNATFINKFTENYQKEKHSNGKWLFLFRLFIFIVFGALIWFAIYDFENFSKDTILKHLLVSIPLIGLLIYLLRIEKNYLLEYKNNKEKYYKLNALIPFIKQIYAKKVENGIETQEDVLSPEEKKDNLSPEEKKDVFEIGKTFFNNSEVQDKSKDISLQDIEKISNILKVKEK